MLHQKIPMRQQTEKGALTPLSLCNIKKKNFFFFSSGNLELNLFFFQSGKLPGKGGGCHV